jgi:hypothetical protein
MMRYLAAAIVVAFVSAVTHAGDTDKKVFPRFDSYVVTHGASLTWRNYVGWWNATHGTPLGGDRELPANLWADGLAKLKPKYVYTHGVNVVIVRSVKDRHEEGFYVSLSISSGPGPNDKQFTRMLIAPHAAGTVYTFRRRGHFQRAAAKQKKTRGKTSAQRKNAGRGGSSGR